MPHSRLLSALLHSLLIVAEGRHWLDVNLCNGPSTSTLASSLDARRVKAAVERRKVLPVAYVQFRGMNTRLKDAILLTMSWGNEVVLLSDVPVVSTNSTFGPALARRFHYFPIDYTGCEEYQSAYNALHEQHPHLFANYPREAILAGGWWRVYSVHKLYSEMSTGGTAFYHADTHFIGSSAQFQNVYPMMNTKASGAAPLRRYPLDLGLPAGDTSFRPFSAHSCKPP